MVYPKAQHICKFVLTIKVSIRLQSGSTPSQIQQQLIVRATANGEKISEQNVPTKQLCYNLKALQKRSNLPTPDAIHNILLKHGTDGTDFCRQLHLYPVLSLVFATPTGLCLMEKYPDAIMVDGTFDYCEGKLILTTWMIKMEGLAFPCAWILSDSRTAMGYHHSFQRIKSDAPSLFPKAFFVDFELALKQAISMTYPSSLIYGDSFHFIWNNQKKLTSELKGYPDFKKVKKVVTFDLRLLQLAESEKSFYEQLNLFINKYTASEYLVLVHYMNYFKNQWLGG